MLCPIGIRNYVELFYKKFMINDCLDYQLSVKDHLIIVFNELWTVLFSEESSKYSPSIKAIYIYIYLYYQFIFSFDTTNLPQKKRKNSLAFSTISNKLKN